MEYKKYNFENLEVYKIGCDFVVKIYAVSANFPKEELFGLVSQIRRAVVSVVLNIVEGSARGSRQDFARFVRQAISSLVEVKAILILSVKLGFLERGKALELMGDLHELFCKLNAFLKSLSERK